MFVYGREIILKIYIMINEGWKSEKRGWGRISGGSIFLTAKLPCRLFLSAADADTFLWQ